MYLAEREGRGDADAAVSLHAQCSFVKANGATHHAFWNLDLAKESGSDAEILAPADDGTTFRCFPWRYEMRSADDNQSSYTSLHQKRVLDMSWPGNLQGSMCVHYKLPVVQSVRSLVLLLSHRLDCNAIGNARCRKDLVGEVVCKTSFALEQTTGGMGGDLSITGVCSDRDDKCTATRPGPPTESTDGDAVLVRVRGARAHRRHPILAHANET